MGDADPTVVFFCDDYTPAPVATSYFVGGGNALCGEWNVALVLLPACFGGGNWLLAVRQKNIPGTALGDRHGCCVAAGAAILFNFLLPQEGLGPSPWQRRCVEGRGYHSVAGKPVLLVVTDGGEL